MRTVLLLAVLGLAGLSAAQQWTVQLAAFQDFRQASARIAELGALGFDAYSEFAMKDGRQYVRVRVGCFTSRDAAVSFAGDLRGRVNAEAVAQPLTAAAGPRACIQWLPGFVKPEQWRIVRRGVDLVFRVEQGGHVGFLQHDGRAWRFGHSLTTEPEPTATATSLFREVAVSGVDLVRVRLSDGSAVNACGGELLWQRGLVAVVERSNTVIACVVNEPSVDNEF